MAADNNIFIRITGETNMDAVSKKLDELNGKLSEYEKDLARISKDEAEAAKYIREHADEYDNLDKAIADNAKYYQQLRKAMMDEQSATEKSIKTLELNSKAVNLLAGSNKSAVSQMRDMREALYELEEAGMENGEAYEALAVKAAQMSDATGDLQQRIRVLASDTANLDAAMSAGSGIAGAFNAASSAAELLGGETEGLQKAFYKVQATLSILNGVQEVSNALNKDSAFRVIVAAKAKKLFTNETKAEAAMQAFANKMTRESASASKLGAVGLKALSGATTGLTKGMKFLRIAIAGTGIGLLLLAIVPLIAYFSELNDTLGSSFEGWDKFKQVVSGVFEVIKGSIANIGEALVKFVSGDFSGALDAIKKVGQVAAKYEMGVAKEAAEQAVKVTNELYDLASAANKRAQERYAKSLQDGLRAISLAQNKAKSDAQARHASEVDMAAEELRFAQQRAALTQEQNTKALKANQREVDAAAKLLKAKGAALKAQKAGTQQYLDALNEFNDAQSNYNDTVQRSTDLQQAIDDANQEVIDAGQALRDAVEAQQEELINAKISLMAEGSDKEIAQINANYDRQLKNLQGNTEQEIALRKSLEEKRDREIQKVRDDENYEAEQIEKKHQLAMAQMQANMGGLLPSQKIAAAQSVHDRQVALYDSEEAHYKDMLDKELISKNEYDQKMNELSEQRAQTEIDLQTATTNAIIEGLQTALEKMQQLSSMVFDALASNVQAELDALDEEYTTDAKEAAKNANKKYISEKEYEQKKAKLQEKQAKYKKAQALTDIAIATSLAIMTALATNGPLGFVMAALAGAMGAVQLGIAASKPLAQYAKGRKGGPGEYALVGEKGPEIMYVPQGASIVPNNKMDNPASWAQYGVPPMPSLSPEDMDGVMSWRPVGQEIDYDRLGKAVADNLPAQKAVTVNVDRSGIRVNDNGNIHTHLNKKYIASWS